MVVVSLVQEDATDSEKVTKFFQTRNAFDALRYDKPMEHLVSGPVALAPRPV